ncbi:MAG: LacI family transcriptional regulator [Synergistaceae bacterium]|jgi:LacI family transcriptional regulator|nr:LacI family transcriptional regulator [Synergistaceae bacterium]
MVTIREIALEASVSISTVSRVLNGHARVNPEMQERVLAVAKRRHYEPNFFAKGLRSGQARTIAFIIPDIANPMFPPMVLGVENMAHSRGYRVVLCNTNEDVQTEKEYIASLNHGLVDGFIFATALPDSYHIVELHDSGVPVVLVSRIIGEDQKIDGICIDNRRAAYKAVRYLLDQGIREIAMLGGSSRIVSYVHRLEGYRRALNEAGVPYREELVYTVDSIDPEEAAQNIYKIYKNTPIPEGIFAASDPKAVGAIHALKKLGYSIPRDVSIISIDDLYFSTLIEPPLTTMKQPFYEMGNQAAELLMDGIEKQWHIKEGPCLHFVDVHLKRRMSTRAEEKEGERQSETSFFCPAL